MGRLVYILRITTELVPFMDFYLQLCSRWIVSFVQVMILLKCVTKHEPKKFVNQELRAANYPFNCRITTDTEEVVYLSYTVLIPAATVKILLTHQNVSLLAAPKTCVTLHLPKKCHAMAFCGGV